MNDQKDGSLIHQGYVFSKDLQFEKQKAQLAIFENTYAWLLAHLPEQLDRCWALLEVGQGKYGWSHWYKNHFDNVAGIDIEDYSCFHPGVTSYVGDVTEPLPLPDCSVDLIVSHSVLEHVDGVEAALQNLDRVLKVGGYVFITISPLYFSASGSHVNKPEKLVNWEHLDPESPHYLIDNPMKTARTTGHYLNQMTYSDFISWTAKCPWSICQSSILLDEREIPSHVNRSHFSEVDLRTKGFFFLAKKESHFTK